MFGKWFGIGWWVTVFGAAALGGVRLLHSRSNPDEERPRQGSAIPEPRHASEAQQLVVTDSNQSCPPVKGAPGGGDELTLEGQFQNQLAKAREQEAERVRQYELAVARVLAAREDRIQYLNTLDKRIHRLCWSLADSLGQGVVKLEDVVSQEEMRHRVPPVPPFYSGISNADGHGIPILSERCAIQYHVDVGIPAHLHPYVRITLSVGALLFESSPPYGDSRLHCEQYPAGLTVDVVVSRQPTLTSQKAADGTWIFYGTKRFDYVKHSATAFVRLENLSLVSDADLADLIGRVINSIQNDTS
jgi:hypothetical protein